MDFTKITIKDLTNIAGINRKTFYLHYYSLEEILCKLQNEFEKERRQSDADDLLNTLDTLENARKNMQNT